MWHPNINGSPETDYFRVPPPRAKHASRWKEDWEELELLVRRCLDTLWDVIDAFLVRDVARSAPS